MTKPLVWQVPTPVTYQVNPQLAPSGEMIVIVSRQQHLTDTTCESEICIGLGDQADAATIAERFHTIVERVNQLRDQGAAEYQAMLERHDLYETKLSERDATFAAHLDDALQQRRSNRLLLDSLHA